MPVHNNRLSLSVGQRTRAVSEAVLETQEVTELGQLQPPRHPPLSHHLPTPTPLLPLLHALSPSVQSAAAPQEIHLSRLAVSVNVWRLFGPLCPPRPDPRPSPPLHHHHHHLFPRPPTIPSLPYLPPSSASSVICLWIG